MSTVKEALAVIEAARNFMASLAADPAVPAHAAEAITKHIDALDRYIDGALEVPNGSATDDIKTPPLPAELRDVEPEARDYARAAVLADRERRQPDCMHTVPWQPTEQQWSGLARDIIMWMDMGKPTGAALYSHLRMLKRDIPAWLIDEVEDRPHVPSKGTRATIVYKAMLYDAAMAREAVCD